MQSQILSWETLLSWSIISCVNAVATVLDRLYSGLRRAKLSNSSSTSAALRSIRSISDKTTSTHPVLHSSGVVQARRKLLCDKTLTLNFEFVLQGIPHSSCFPTLYEGAEWEIRGSFVPLDCLQVELPRYGTGMPAFCMERLPFEIQEVFVPENNSHIQPSF